MIALLLGLLAAGPRIVEAPQPSAQLITVQMIVHTGTLGAKGRALAQIAADTIADGTEGYNRYRLLEFGTQAGEPIRASVSGDHLLIQVAVPKGQLDLAADLANELLRHARFEEDTIKEELDKAPARIVGYWTEAIQPWRLHFDRIRRQDVTSFYARTFVLEETTVAIGGAFKEGSARRAFEKQFQDWTSPRKSHWSDTEPAEELAKHSFPITTAELWGGDYPGDDSIFPAQLLAATALGVGKGSAMHRILRERMGLSYRQEAVVTPTSLGFRTRLILCATPSDRDAGLTDVMRSALLADVTNWTEADRIRALGMAKGFLLNQAPVNPLYFDGAKPIGASLEDQAFMQGFWMDKTGSTWDPGSILEQMKKQSLEDLKKTATEFLNAAHPRLITGKQ